MRSPHISVTIDLDRIRCAAEEIRTRAGVPLIAVVKADAYGCGAAAVIDALRSVVDEFAFFSIAEAQHLAAQTAKRLGRGKRAAAAPLPESRLTPGLTALILGPPDAAPAEYAALRLRPSVGTLEEAAGFASLPVAIHVDTGMQRFGLPPEHFDDVRRRCTALDAYTHAIRPEAAAALRDAAHGKVQFLHAAASTLLEFPDAWLNAVRPGVALYRGSVRVTARLQSVRATSGAVGYTGFECPHVGIITAGYSNLISRAPILINGRRQKIMEVGMNSSFVSVDPRDRPGDEVLLLGDSLSEAELAHHLDIREHEVLTRYTRIGRRRYAPHAGTAMNAQRVAGSIKTP